MRQSLGAAAAAANRDDELLWMDGGFGGLRSNNNVVFLTVPETVRENIRIARACRLFLGKMMIFIEPATTKTTAFFNTEAFSKMTRLAKFMRGIAGHYLQIYSNSQ